MKVKAYLFYIIYYSGVAHDRPAGQRKLAQDRTSDHTRWSHNAESTRGFRAAPITQFSLTARKPPQTGRHHHAPITMHRLAADHSLLLELSCTTVG